VPLLSAMFRAQAIYGTTDTLGGRVAGRQGGAWARRTVAAASPHPPHRPAPHPVPVPEADLADLRRRGIIDDAELAALRARYGTGA
jgi:hypothetical protein